MRSGRSRRSVMRIECMRLTLRPCVSYVLVVSCVLGGTPLLTDTQGTVV